jgi:hypothetical protein
MHRQDQEFYTRYYYRAEEGMMSADSFGGVPEEYIDVAETAARAASYLTKLGCVGRSQHNPKDSYHITCLDALRQYIAEFGEVFEGVLRGTRSSRSEQEYKILFGTTDREVAEFYGDEVKEYAQILGIRILSARDSVKEGSNEPDEEILFFPEGILCQ